MLQGAFVHDSTITNAIIGLRAIIGKGCTIQVRHSLSFG